MPSQGALLSALIVFRASHPSLGQALGNMGWRKDPSVGSQSPGSGYNSLHVPSPLQASVSMSLKWELNLMSGFSHGYTCESSRVL